MMSKPTAVLVCFLALAVVANATGNNTAANNATSTPNPQTWWEWFLGTDPEKAECLSTVDQVNQKLSLLPEMQLSLTECNAGIADANKKLDAAKVQAELLMTQVANLTATVDNQSALLANISAQQKEDSETLGRIEKLTFGYCVKTAIGWFLTACTAGPVLLLVGSSGWYTLGRANSVASFLVYLFVLVPSTAWYSYWYIEANSGVISADTILKGLAVWNHWIFASLLSAVLIACGWVIFSYTNAWSIPCNCCCSRATHTSSTPGGPQLTFWCMGKNREAPKHETGVPNTTTPGATGAETVGLSKQALHKSLAFFSTRAAAINALINSSPADAVPAQAAAPAATVIPPHAPVATAAVPANPVKKEGSVKIERQP